MCCYGCEHANRVWGAPLAFSPSLRCACGDLLRGERRSAEQSRGGEQQYVNFRMATSLYLRSPDIEARRIAPDHRESSDV